MQLRAIVPAGRQQRGQHDRILPGQPTDRDTARGQDGNVGNLATRTTQSQSHGFAGFASAQLDLAVDAVGVDRCLADEIENFSARGQWLVHRQGVGWRRRQRNTGCCG
jgi:hypothetical protein